MGRAHKQAKLSSQHSIASHVLDKRSVARETAARVMSIITPTTPQRTGVDLPDIYTLGKIRSIFIVSLANSSIDEESFRSNIYLITYCLLNVRMEQ